MWQQLSVTTDKIRSQVIETVLMNFGALSITFSDALDQPQYEPLPGETKLWDHTRVTGLFPDNAPFHAIQAYLLARDLIPSKRALTLEKLADEAWERAWMKDFKPMQFGQSLWICPTGFQVEQTDAHIIALDPGLAFGTGTHPTTALCLEWLDQYPPIGQHVIDYGCGSGVLTVAALKLGAQHCCAVDIDPQALEATLNNAEKNHTMNLTCHLPVDFQSPPVDVLVANILAEPLIQNAALFADLLKTHGRIVLSGILQEQTDQVIDAYAELFAIDSPQCKEEWMLISGVKKSA